MPNMKKVLMMLIVSIVCLSGAGRAQATNAKPRATQQDVEHIVLVNMSGKAREAHVGDAVIALPVAERVALQVHPGEKITITSSTDRTIVRVITPVAKDDGRTISVN